MMLSKLKFYVITVVLSIFAMSGCSVLSTVSEDKNELAVKYGTMKVIERDDVSVDRVLKLVADAKAYAEKGVMVSVSKLADEARAKLAESNISPADKMLIEVILARAEERIKAEIGFGVLSEDQRLQLLTVLNWIEEAARGSSISP